MEANEDGQYFASHSSHLVHDPNSSLVLGDVVELHRLRVSTAVHHVVAKIVSPFGTPIDSRPPVPSPDDRLAAYKMKRFAKLRRRDLRRQAAEGNAESIAKLRSMDLDPRQGIESGKGGKGGKGKTAKGQKEQILPKSVVSVGRHEENMMNDRAKRNKVRASRSGEKAEGSLLEARERKSEIEESGVSADPEAGTTVVRGRVD